MNSSAENSPFRSEESFTCSKYRHETDMTAVTCIHAFAFEVCSKSSIVARKWISHSKFASSRFCRRTIIHSMFEFLIKRNYFKLSSSFQSFNPVIFVRRRRRRRRLLKSCGICRTFSSTYLWLRESFEEIKREEERNFLHECMIRFSLKVSQEFYKNEGERWKTTWRKSLLYDKLPSLHSQLAHKLSFAKQHVK